MLPPVSDLSWQTISTRVAAATVPLGFDLVQPFDVARYNVGVSTTEQLNTFERARTLGILLGNTRQLWPRFTRAFADDAALQNAAHPLDTYVVSRLTAVMADVTSARTELVFSHVTKPNAFPIQRLAERVGLAAVAPSHLAIHPTHGPWFALRAVVVVDVEGPPAPPPLLLRPCVGCSAPCVPALEDALAASGTPLSSTSVAAHADAWIAVRDACPVGRASRYGEAQLAYHYGAGRSRIRLES